MKIVNIIKIIFNLILGGMLIFGGIEKFDKPAPAPTEIVDTIKKGEQVAPSVEILKIKNYIFGMKQTNYFWQFLGFAELLAGILLVSQVFSLMGAIIALPITINIFLFHLFLEAHETAELLQMLALLIINLMLIGFSYQLWKPILYNKQILKFS